MRPRPPTPKQVFPVRRHRRVFMCQGYSLGSSPKDLLTPDPLENKVLVWTDPGPRGSPSGEESPSPLHREKTAKRRNRRFDDAKQSSPFESASDEKTANRSKCTNLREGFELKQLKCFSLADEKQEIESENISFPPPSSILCRLRLQISSDVDSRYFP